MSRAMGYSLHDGVNMHVKHSFRTCLLMPLIHSFANKLLYQQLQNTIPYIIQFTEIRKSLISFQSTSEENGQLLETVAIW